jgi:hypothetical protein
MAQRVPYRENSLSNSLLQLIHYVNLNITIIYIKTLHGKTPLYIQKKTYAPSYGV